MKKTKQKFKIGEKVMFVGNGDMGIEKNEIVKIIGIVMDDSEGYPYRIKCKCDNYYPVGFEEIEKLVKVSKKKLDEKKKSIIKEIKKNKEFLECFDDVNEVKDWDDYKVMNWN